MEEYKMRITGKLVDDTAVMGEEVTIEPFPVDPKKLYRIGSVEVLVKGKYCPDGTIAAYTRDIVYVFPALEKPGEGKEGINLPDKMPVFLTNKDDILTYLGWTNTSLNTLIDVVREMKERMK